MRPPPRIPLRVALALAALVLLALLVASLYDRSAAVAAEHEAPILLAGGAFVSRFGLSGYMLLLSALVAVAALVTERRAARRRLALRARRLAERALFFFAAIAFSGIVCQIIKHLVGRARPRFVDALGAFHLSGPTVASGFDSFPSGHSTTAFAAATALALMRPAWAVALYPLAALIAVSRIFAEAHYPSDTIAGAALGTALTVWLARRFAARDIAFPLPVSRGRP